MVAFFLLKDLSSNLRDQLMVSEHDRALVEARARGLSEQDVLAATAHPWRQILKFDLIGSAIGISIFLLLYYAASAFFTIYWATVFKDPTGSTSPRPRPTASTSGSGGPTSSPSSSSACCPTSSRSASR